MLKNESLDSLAFKMPKFRKLLQTVCLVLVCGSVFLVLFQKHITSSNEIRAQQLLPRWQDRGTKSKDYEESESNNFVITSASGLSLSPNVIANGSDSYTSKSISDPGKSVDLESVFISVKTTSIFHKSRLPIILKTWFQLAKHQGSDNWWTIVPTHLSECDLRIIFFSRDNSAPASFVCLSDNRYKLSAFWMLNAACSYLTTTSWHGDGVPLNEWFIYAETWFFTDTDDEHFQKETNNHMINTDCSSSHGRKALCCKMSVEFDVFLESNKKWFCHFDDDNYVNVPRLTRLLANYSPQEDWYLGKPSIRAPLVILNREDKNFSKNRQNVTFWFATGGAGFCLSRALALKMKPVAGEGKFMSIGEKIRLPDDVTMGYIIEHMLGKSLSMVDEFHSHLEPMKFLRQDTFQDQITFSYSQYGEDDMNVVKIDGFDPRIDRTRFLSLHCFLFPYFTFCPR